MFIGKFQLSFQEIPAVEVFSSCLEFLKKIYAITKEMSDKICKVCNESVSKYKCPVCLIKYCSVACYKSHKTGDECVKPEVISNENPVNDKRTLPDYEFETQDTVKPEKLNLLGMDKNVRNSLENPHLREMVKYLDSTSDPVKGIEQAMKEPIFVEFVEHCLRVVED